MPKIHMAGLAESDGVVFKTIPAGQYKVRVTGVEESETSDESKYPGTPTTRLKLTVVPGEDEEGHKLVFSLTHPNPEEQEEEFVRQCVAKFKNLILASGLEDEIEEDNFDPGVLMGAEFTVVVIEKEYQGKKQNQVQDCLRNG